MICVQCMHYEWVSKKDQIRCLDTTYKFYNFILYYILYLL